MDQDDHCVPLNLDIPSIIDQIDILPFDVSPEIFGLH